MSAWYVYILQCRNKSLYTGMTNDLEKRVEQHNEGKGGKFTRSFRPVTLVYSEKLKSESDARKREAEIKKMSRTKKLILIEK